MVRYDSAGRVDRVTGPADSAAAASARNPAQPDSAAYWPRRSYAYDSPTSTRVHAAGAPEPNGWDRKVDFDAPRGRLVRDTDALGRAATATWDDADRLVTTTDAAGRTAATTYDAAGRPRETYGPYPSAPGGLCGRRGGLQRHLPAHHHHL